MMELARPRLAGLPVTLVHANFDQLAGVLANLGIEQLDGFCKRFGLGKLERNHHTSTKADRVHGEKRIPQLASKPF